MIADYDICFDYEKAIRRICKVVKFNELSNEYLIDFENCIAAIGLLNNKVSQEMLDHLISLEVLTEAGFMARLDDGSTWISVCGNHGIISMSKEVYGQYCS